MSSRHPRRIAAITAAALAGAVAVGGCAGSEVAAPSAPPRFDLPETAVAVEDAPSGPEQMSEVRARMLADAAVLRAKDLPRHVYEEPADAAPVLAPSGDGCMSAGTAVPRVHVPEVNFDAGDNFVSSTADVLPTAEQARAEFSAARKKKATNCYASTLRGLFAAQGDRVTAATTTLKSAKVLGADDAFAYRFSLTFDVPGGQATMAGYLVAALVDSTQIWVTSTKVGAMPPGLAAAQDLAAIAVDRVHRAAAGPERDPNPAESLWELPGALLET